jgi:hypothetical protein
VNHAGAGEERTQAVTNMMAAAKDFLAGLAAYYQGCEGRNCCLAATDMLRHDRVTERGEVYFYLLVDSGVHFPRELYPCLNSC